jgi:hypothetical protein
MSEEHFAPDAVEEMMEPAPARRFVKARTVTTRGQKRALERDALTSIIADVWVDKSDSGAESDSSKGSNKHEERIHYLKLDLANAKLEIDTLKEENEALKKRDEALTQYNAALELIKVNIACYDSFGPMIKTTPFAELIRRELEQVKPNQALNLDPLSTQIQTILTKHYAVLQKQEKCRRDTFHENILLEKSKATTIMILKCIAAAAFALYILVMLVRMAF